MPKISVNGVNLAYEILGKGSPVVFTPGGFDVPKETSRWLAGRMSLGYRALVYDRRNSGASDVLFENAPSELQLFADDLYALLESLEMTPAYLWGGSGGLLASLLTAYQYPESVKGLLLESVPTDDHEFYQNFARDYYIESAELAESKGMEAVVEFSNDSVNWAQRIKQNPAGKEQFLSLDPTEFSAIMRQWGKWCTSGRAHLGGLTDKELGRISAPAIIIPGIDEFHPQHTAEELHRLLPKSELFSREEFFSPIEVDQLRELHADDDGRAMAAYAPVYDSFIKKVETEQS
jgi:pimeloyl-ACP methyl ester carboxylesterase